MSLFPKGGVRENFPPHSSCLFSLQIYLSQHTQKEMLTKTTELLCVCLCVFVCVALLAHLEVVAVAMEKQGFQRHCGLVFQLLPESLIQSGVALLEAILMVQNSNIFLIPQHSWIHVRGL